MPTLTVYRPGQTCPVSGQYEIVDEYNRRTGTERTCVRGEPFPATPRPNMGYVLVDPTQH